ncbi:MAG TPA: DNA repair protein RecO [Gemmatimonadaceae bacterium]|nr:DNA repair protein RecO [Gemmatimonadaceae bacterium]
MPLLSTEAIVLHVFDYSETSRILRLATRDAGVVSALARGARRAKSRFGSALDLFAQGTAQLYLKEGRELQTMSAFDVTHARPALGTDLGRFASASALVELVQRFGMGDASEELFAVLTDALDGIVSAAPDAASEAGLAAAWRLVAHLGFSPALTICSVCHTELALDGDVAFSHRAGGSLCQTCAALYARDRTLPAAARASIVAWSNGRRTSALTARDARAHQRLLREFLHEHLADGRALRALDAWEHGGWSAP